MSKATLFKKTKKYIIPFLLVAGVIFFLARRNAVTVAVRRVEVKDREIKKSISASGSVKSRNQADLSFLVSGVISKINVSNGDYVKKGDLLVYLDTKTQLETVQSYKDARDIRIRQKELFENEKRSNIKLLGGEDSYNIKLKEYNEGLSQAEAGYQTQLSLLSNYYIYAPFEGIVLDVVKKVGETAIPGASVIKFADLDGKGLVFDVFLDQEDFGTIKEGQQAEIELDAYTGYKFKGVVEKLPVSADDKSGGFEVKIAMEKSDKNVSIGMTGDAYIITDKLDHQAQSLTFNEISYDTDDKPFVWVVEDGKVKRFYIELGLEGDLYTEVKTDLKGKIVVVPAKEDLEIEDGFIPRIIN